MTYYRNIQTDAAGMAVFTVTILGAEFIRIVVQSPAETRNLSHFESTQTGSGTRPSYSVGVGVAFSADKAAGA